MFGRASLAAALILVGCGEAEVGNPDAGLFLPDSGGDAGQTIQDTVLVDWVYDGDTVRLSAGPDAPYTPDGKPLKGEVVRLLGVDAPEITHGTQPGECWGDESAAGTRSLLLGKRVRLEYDEAHGIRDETESHRLLAYIILVDDGSTANGTIIRNGNACSFRRFPHRQLTYFNQLESEARSASRGLWAGCELKCD